MFAVLTGIQHHVSTCQVTLDGKALGPHVDEDTARIVADWLRRLTWPEMERILEHVPEGGDIYRPRRVVGERYIADGNDEWQREVDALADRFDPNTAR